MQNVLTTWSCSTVQSDAPAAGRRTCVLIIEDNHTNAIALRSIFIRKGCDVAVAETVEAGMSMLASRPDYILLDLVLPDGDGLEILKQVRAQQTNHASRVIVTTGVTNPEKIREVLGLQPHRLLRKPIDLVDLLDAIGMM